MRPGINEGETGFFEASSVLMEQVAEVLHPGEEGSELPPSVLTDLLGQDAPSRAEDPSDLRGIEFLVSV